MSDEEIHFRSDFSVQLIQVMGSDQLICQAARVSTLGWASLDSAEAKGLLSYLMRARHGSPFEHCVMTWRVSAPIMVWREFMRHRIASYNEQSGRYMEMEGVFYTAPRERNLQQVGKPGRYEYIPGTPAQFDLMRTLDEIECKVLWEGYQSRLASGISKEMARKNLPLSLYSTAWVTMNLRGLMNFLSLRTTDPDARFPSTPQWEIEQVARAMEKDFKLQFPIVSALFREAGSVCP